MDLREIKETPIWTLYEKGRNYHRRTGIYTDTDRNYRMYNGDQWAGAKLGGVEPVQKNFIKPIVKYKLAVIHDNLYGVVCSSMNYEKSFRKTAEKCCEKLNDYIARLWELDKMDDKMREVTKDAAINDEGIVYSNWDAEESRPVHEVIKKNDIYYGDENDDIQNQPYILIRRRKPVLSVIELALSEGIGKDKLELIIGDNDTFEESGEAAKEEIDNKVTVVYKFYKQNGTVHYSIATKWLEIANDIDLGITLYPIAHMTWENKEGSARGEGEVRHLIPNQIEVNRTEVRRVLTVKHTAFQQKVVDVSKIANPGALDTVGATIRTNGAPVEDVHKIVGYIPPAQMSRDVVELQEGLITLSRELAGAGDTATGQVNPEAASGRAILAVQQASQAPMTEQKEKTKSIIEDIAKIDIEYIVTYSEDGISVEETVKDERTGEETTQLIKVPQSVLENLKTFVKIDVTPKGVYDKYAREMSLENFLTNGLFNIQRLPELKAYVKALPNDSVVPKDALLKVIEEMEAEQRKIALIQAEAEALQERAQQFLWEDPDGQAEQIADAQRDIEAQMAAEEAELDEETAEAEEEIEE